MTTSRRAERATPSFIQARVPHDLYEAVDAYADAYELTLSEALRRLLVKALDDMGVKHTITDESGTREDDAWRQPLQEDQQG